MRYNVNQQYAFLIIQFEREWNRADNGPPTSTKHDRDVVTFYPFECGHSKDKLIGIHAVMLTCKSHHKVSIDYDPESEKRYDGFIFEDADGNEWYNQYPHASYGQVSTESDNRVWLHPTNEATYNDPDVIVEMEDAMHRLEEIQHGIWLCQGNKPSWSSRTVSVKPEDAIALQGLFDKVKSRIEEVAGRKIVLDPLMVQDGTADAPLETNHWLEGHWKARFEDQPEYPVWGFRKKEEANAEE